jgi:multicomponent Na+:H+ antiporter subunit D
MLIVPAVLLAGALVIGVIPGAVPGIEVAAARFGDHAAYFDWVLHGGPLHFAAVSPTHVAAFDYLYAGGSVLGAMALAAVALFGWPLRDRVPATVLEPATAAIGGLRRLHSGHIGDYIAWWTAGAAVLGGASLVFLT